MNQTNSHRLLAMLVMAVWLPMMCRAQFNSGSNGSDDAFNPTTNTVIDMAYHPDGIYHYTSVNIPSGVTVTFIPNANNTPVMWLVQSNCVIAGTVSVKGSDQNGVEGGLGGPGGFRGGKGPLDSQTPPGSGYGPGGGNVSLGDWIGGNASFGSVGSTNIGYGIQHPSGETYGNKFLLPFIGGSGGGGGIMYYAFTYRTGGGGGGGAILVAASGSISITGTIDARGGGNAYGGGGGSGGAIRLMSGRVLGTGILDAEGGRALNSWGGGTFYSLAGRGRIRIDALEDGFVGQARGEITRGFQPVIIPSVGQLPHLTVISVGGVPVSASPGGVLSTPDAVLSAQQNNPVPIAVRCTNLPLNTQITVSVKPANGPAVSATGLNSTGTLASSIATVLINMPRGGGIIYATAATGN